jgi:hypothetical protein
MEMKRQKRIYKKAKELEWKDGEGKKELWHFPGLIT